MPDDQASYLRPYASAIRRHGTAFPSLLWASRQTQELRFDAFTRLCDFSGQRVCDAGCGQADLLDYLVNRGMRPAHYVGIEAMSEHVEAARQKQHENCLIVQADFIRHPHRLLVGADLVVFCGSLNTLSEAEFRQTIAHAYAAAARGVVFNFLSSPRLASADWLRWHSPQDVRSYLLELGDDLTMLDDYLDGDCSAILRKPIAR
jgi:SAM-dependent methyltransferase